MLYRNYNLNRNYDLVFDIFDSFKPYRDLPNIKYRISKKSKYNVITNILMVGVQVIGFLKTTPVDIKIILKALNSKSGKKYTKRKRNLGKQQ